jgi:hypothetical protein
MRLIDIGPTLSALAISALGANPTEALEARPEFDAKMTTPSKQGPAQPVHVTVQSWGVSQQNAAQEIPLRGFYVAHLLGGEIATTIDGQMTKRVAGDYWTVSPGSAMQVTVLGEFAVLETIVVAKQ